jgi:hypothetical protein
LLTFNFKIYLDTTPIKKVNLYKNNNSKMKFTLFIFSFFIWFSNQVSYSQTCKAGKDTVLCVTPEGNQNDNGFMLGGSPTIIGEDSNFTFKWELDYQMTPNLRFTASDY